MRRGASDTARRRRKTGGRGMTRSSDPLSACASCRANGSPMPSPQLEQKSYVAGIGEVEEHLTEGGNEHFELVSVTR